MNVLVVYLLYIIYYAHDLFLIQLQTSQFRESISI